MVKDLEPQLDREEAGAVRAGAELDPRAVALLEQIRAAPDDAPRLVLADLIADAHPEHAELIVAQCGSRRPHADLEPRPLSLSAASWDALVERFGPRLRPPARRAGYRW